jgi:hypothetical protein
MIALILRSNPDQFHQKFVAAKIQITSYTQQKRLCGWDGHRAASGAFLRHSTHEYGATNVRTSENKHRNNKDKDGRRRGVEGRHKTRLQL